MHYLCNKVFDIIYVYRVYMILKKTCVLLIQVKLNEGNQGLFKTVLRNLHAGITINHHVEPK